MKGSAIWPAMLAEVRKQHQSRTKGKMVFFSMLLWPALAFLSSYYMMKPYKTDEGSVLSRVIPDGGVPLFLLSGYLVFQLFWTVVQSAWLFEMERKDGTLEIVFLAPSSKMAFLYGRSLYSLFHGIWMFALFSLLMFLFILDPRAVNWPALLMALLVILISAVVWGALLCSLALFSRDSGLLYYVFQAPMELFGGVRIPPAVFPAWASALSFIFPVTYGLVLVRGALDNDIGGGWWLALAVLAAATIILAACTRYLLMIAERHARSKGNWTLF
ncbi:ABC transporter permease [Gorillibacterium massiliense]|uniref:ABC transporter permease n=1 Tax=Gorillibacterium massiliense TaxID=1280390 RepID=UPI0004B3C208|nr:ABC transporter permease [Gorillibacterium massiliense]